MYSLPHFQESRAEVLAGLIQRYPLGCVTTQTSDGLVADHVPLSFDGGKLNKLTDKHEADQPHPWRIADAPTGFTETLLAHIVGIELTVHRLQGKWKISQNQPLGNQATVVQGLLEGGSLEQLQMAQLMGNGGRC